MKFKTIPFQHIFNTNVWIRNVLNENRIVLYGFTVMFPDLVTESRIFCARKKLAFLYDNKFSSLIGRNGAKIPGQFILLLPRRANSI